jgi:hypothetical protein
MWRLEEDDRTEITEFLGLSMIKSHGYSASIENIYGIIVVYVFQLFFYSKKDDVK